MATAKVYSQDGQVTGEQTLSAKLFDTPVKPFRIHQYIRGYLANQRQGTHSTLGRSEVAGGGSKPWRQKGTGRARVGTTSSPIWIGGGVTFGPKPRSYRSKLPKKMKRQAITSAFTLKAKEDRLRIVEVPELEKPQTRQVARMLADLNIAGKKVLLLYEGVERNLQLSCRNIPGLKYRRAALASAYDLIEADYLLLTPRGLKECEEVFGK
ncbi:MAG: 50S ribosomal protein L4 [candidate division Zixibacteria bacterium]|nr:50S ribosomal protein L4 [candidate division Zixibacteria bacterium]